jgi:hypothetical protein
MAAASLPRLQQQVEALARLQQGPEAHASLCEAVFGVSCDVATLSHMFDLATGHVACSAGARHVAATAAWVCLQRGQYPALVQQFVQGAFLPLAVAGHGTPAGRCQLHQCGALLAGQQAWGTMLQVLQDAHAALQAFMQLADAISSDGSSTAVGGSSSSSRSGGGASLACAIGCSSLLQDAPVATCQVMAVLLMTASGAAGAPAAAMADAAAAAAATHEQQSAANAEGALDAVLQLAAGALFDTACQLLCCSEAALRQAAFQQLLPACLHAAGAHSPAQRQRCLGQLLARCLDMVARPVVPRRMGLAVLLQHIADFDLQPPPAPSVAAGGPRPTAEGCAATGGTDAGHAHASSGSSSSSTSSECFWALLRECLVDPEPLNRKRALRLMQLLLPRPQLQAQPQWGVLLALYELLDEFTPHLVKATWPLVSGVSAACRGCACACACAHVR